ncbi:MAG: hypothetical protein HYZ25_09540 [Chloroflexi bacterium]|nr:hypothetical protein [Chloroflexota bacterium]
MRSSFFRPILFGLFMLVIVSTATAFAAGISVSSSNVDGRSIAVTAEDLKPSACEGILLAHVVSGSGTFTGTSGNDLIIGSPNADFIDGQGGDDCILGGGGDDTLLGNDGTDICLGNQGNDVFTNCEMEEQ